MEYMKCQSLNKTLEDITESLGIRTKEVSKLEGVSHTQRMLTITSGYFFSKIKSTWNI